jgi:hypothetical protein
MRTRTIGVRQAILAAVAGAAALTTTACTSCPSSETVRDDTKEIEAARVCEALANAATANGGVDCAAVCGGGYTNCYFDEDYTAAYRARTVDCPAPADSKPTVKLRCLEKHSSNELTFGGCVSEGRRPERLVAAEPCAHEEASRLGRYFATVAHLEAAAVLAFEHMIAELLEHGAPRDLIEAARAARRDEIRHARATTRLAKRFGVVPPAAHMAPTPIRDLFAIALENEIEGVVRETLGAAIATWRAEHASDPDVRAVMGFIAEDERRHAELSWQVATWVRARLDVRERARLDERRRAAIDELPATLGGDPAREVQELAGAPRNAIVQELIAKLDRELWSAAA